MRKAITAICLMLVMIMGGVISNKVKAEEGINEYLAEMDWEEIKEHEDELFTKERGSNEFKCLMEQLKDIERSREPNKIVRQLIDPLKDMDYNTFCKGCEIIIKKFNDSNEIKANIYLKKYNDDFITMSMFSYENPVEYVGQSARIKIGARYYESSSNFGEGEMNDTFEHIDYGVKRSKFIPEDYIVIVNGISYLDDNGQIIDSIYMPYEEINKQQITIQKGTKYMLHICTEERDLGWILPEALEAQ